MSTKWGRYLLFSISIIFFGSISHASDFSDDGIWQRIPEESIQRFSSRSVTPKTYLVFHLNREILQSVLTQAPMEFTPASKNIGVILSLPMPDGRYLRFRIEESPIMQSGLAAQFPLIKTYRAQGIDDATITARFGWTSGGFHAFGLTSDRSFSISSYQYGDLENYISYWSDEEGTPDFQCLTGEKEKIFQLNDRNNSPLSGPTLRTFTAAIAGNGEYT
ncbi:MAG TPA: hypothetical protein VLH08_18265, partial [Acidobacteriota bacterium]|nr:hypothetical protein [Acidobacteriota bacterium]